MGSKSISVIGAGSWGTALSILLAKKGYKVDLWVYEENLCEQIRKKKEITPFKKGFFKIDSQLLNLGRFDIFTFCSHCEQHTI